MRLDNQALFRILKWAWVCDNGFEMNSADYELAIQIALQVGNTTLAEEFTRAHFETLDSEAA